MVENCSRCKGKMISIPVGDHSDLACPTCGPVAPLYCTKNNEWK